MHENEGILVKITHVPHGIDIAEVLVRLAFNGSAIEMPDLNKPILTIKTIQDIQKLATEGVIVQILAP